MPHRGNRTALERPIPPFYLRLKTRPCGALETGPTDRIRLWSRQPCENCGILWAMRIRHRGLRRLAERDDPSRVPPELLPRIRLRLAQLAAAQAPGDMDLPGARLHPLSGERAGQWSVRVSGNWRIVFRFEGREAVDVDLVDYH